MTCEGYVMFNDNTNINTTHVDPAWHAFLAFGRQKACSALLDDSECK